MCNGKAACTLSRLFLICTAVHVVLMVLQVLICHHCGSENRLTQSNNFPLHALHSPPPRWPRYGPGPSPLLGLQPGEKDARLSARSSASPRPLPASTRATPAMQLLASLASPGSISMNTFTIWSGGRLVLQGTAHHINTPAWHTFASSYSSVHYESISQVCLHIQAVVWSTADAAYRALSGLLGTCMR